MHSNFSEPPFGRLNGLFVAACLLAFVLAPAARAQVGENPLSLPGPPPTPIAMSGARYQIIFNTQTETIVNIPNPIPPLITLSQGGQLELLLQVVAPSFGPNYFIESLGFSPTFPGPGVTGNILLDYPLIQNDVVQNGKGFTSTLPPFSSFDSFVTASVIS